MTVCKQPAIAWLWTGVRIRLTTISTFNSLNQAGNYMCHPQWHLNSSYFAQLLHAFNRLFFVRGRHSAFHEIQELIPLHYLAKLHSRRPCYGSGGWLSASHHGGLESNPRTVLVRVCHYGGQSGAGTVFFSQYFGVPLTVPFHYYSIGSFFLGLLLPEVEADEACEPLKNAVFFRLSWTSG